MPSSQFSVPLIFLSPHFCRRTHGLPGSGQTYPSSTSPQFEVQPSPVFVLPSSQASPCSCFPLPHTAGSGGVVVVPPAVLVAPPEPMWIAVEPPLLVFVVAVVEDEVPPLPPTSLELPASASLPFEVSGRPPLHADAVRTAQSNPVQLTLRLRRNRDLSPRLSRRVLGVTRIIYPKSS